MRSALTVVLVLTLACAPLEASADVSNDWSTVRVLPLGTRLKVVTGNGKSVDGTLRSVSEASLTVSEKAKDVVILKEETRRVYVTEGRTVGKTAGVGALIGAGGGAVAGAMVGGGCKPGDWFCISRGEAGVVLGVVGAAVGAVTGVIVGAFRHKRRLVYESR